MKPSHEMIRMPDAAFPVKAILRSYKNEEYIYVHPHWHSAVEILLIANGKAVQQINGQIFEACKGSLIVIPPEQIHSTYTDKNVKNEILVVQFKTDFLESSACCTSEKNLISRFSEEIDFPNPIGDETLSGRKAAECVKGIYEELKEKRNGFELFAKAYILRFIGIMARDFSNRRRAKENCYRTNRAKDMLKNTFRLIDEKYSLGIALKTAAEASNLSVPHFCRLFKDSTGMTFTEYLAFYRINRAEEMLKSGRSITEIAYECGFGSLATFIRAFKKYRNMTPADCRKKYL